MHAKIFFITGVPGSGKSTILPLLKQTLDTNFELHDFDERGVPDNVTTDWQKEETEHWIKLGKENAKQNISTIICGFALPNHSTIDPIISFVLLDLTEDVLMKRLTERFSDPINILEMQRMTKKSPQEFIEENVRSIVWLRNLCIEANAHVINTSNLSPTEVANKINSYIAQ